MSVIIRAANFDKFCNLAKVSQCLFFSLSTKPFFFMIFIFLLFSIQSYSILLLSDCGIAYQTMIDRKLK